MAVGGDVAMTKDGLTLINYFADYDPDLILLGGDIAYDNGYRSCYYSWDNFYDMFDSINKKLNRIVPIVLSVGNHDVGLPVMRKLKIPFNIEDIPYYFLYHPQHSSNDSHNIPAPENRSTFHIHKIGPMLHFHLDSGYLLSFE
jgi:predicted MPP superfamily phosphohydrolase